MKIVTVIGARPQFIKAAPVSAALRQARIDETVIHTGQHYDHAMSAVFFDDLDIAPPRHSLGLGSGTHGAMTGKMLEAIERIIVADPPQALLVYGDTNSTLAGALAAAKIHIPVIHVEAGLRSYNQAMPEEINRVLTDHLSSLLFCSSEIGRRNLAREGIQRNIHIVGDVMADSCIRARRKASERGLAERLHALQISAPAGQFGLVTIHRAENTDNEHKLASLIQGLAAHAGLLVFPIHPRTQGALTRLGLKLPANLIPIAPVGYLDMAALIAGARVIITDSGGLQKEAYWNKVPCITLRDETEWVETVESGWNKLVGANPQLLLAALQHIEHPAAHPLLYDGDGHASERLVAILKNHFQNQ